VLGFAGKVLRKLGLMKGETSEPRNLVVSVEGRTLSIEVDIGDDVLIERLLDALVQLVRRGHHIKLTQTLSGDFSLSPSTTVAIKVFSDTQEIQSWRVEMSGVLEMRREEV
jgi:hypothetical protein